MGLVKLDVEGSEIAAIRGMHELLAGADAPPVVYESNAHTLRMFDATPEQLIATFEQLGYTNYLIGNRELMPVDAASFQPDTCVDYLAVKGELAPPPRWTVRGPRTERELARVVALEASLHIVDARAQVGRSLARAPEWLLARRDVQLALTALAIDPDDAVARGAAWWTTRGRNRENGSPHEVAHSLAELGRALHDRLAQIRIRWGFRP